LVEFWEEGHLGAWGELAAFSPKSPPLSRHYSEACLAQLADLSLSQKVHLQRMAYSEDQCLKVELDLEFDAQRCLLCLAACLEVNLLVVVYSIALSGRILSFRKTDLGWRCNCWVVFRELYLKGALELMIPLLATLGPSVAGWVVVGWILFFLERVVVAHFEA
jgi:hypothetical protein